MNRNELHKRLIEVAAQSPCRKRKVGAIIAFYIHESDTYQIISEGYNVNHTGPSEYTNVNGELVTHQDLTHAEVNAINNLPNDDIVKPSPKAEIKMYVTHPPCDGCKAAIHASKLEYEVMGDFLKFDQNKPRMSLVPSSIVIGIAKVLTYGAKKYKPDNWRKVTSRERYIDALERHWLAYKDGEEFDEESGLHHLEHLATNAAFLLELKHLPLREENI